MEKITKSYKLLLEAISPYELHWEEWANSHTCFLRVEEKDLIHKCHSMASIEQIAKKMKLSVFQTNMKIQRIAFKLKWKLHMFEQWQKKYPQKAPEGIERLLSANLAYHPFSLKLYYSLRSTTEDNLGNILKKYSEEDLFKISGVGVKTVQELKDYLKKHDCRHLLKSNSANNLP